MRKVGPVTGYKGSEITPTNGENKWVSEVRTLFNRAITSLVTGIPAHLV